MRFIGHLESVLFGDPFKDKETFLKRFHHDFENILQYKTFHHLSSSLEKDPIIYYRPGKHRDIKISLNSYNLAHTDSQIDLKLHIRGRPTSYVEIPRLAKQFLERMWYIGKMDEIKAAYGAKGFSYSVSLAEKAVEEDLYKYIDQKVGEVKKEVEKISKPLTSKEWDLGKETLKHEKEKIASKPSPIPIFVILLNLFSLSLLILLFSSHPRPNITGSVTSSNSLFYPAIASFLLAVFVLFFFRKSRK